MTTNQCSWEKHTSRAHEIRIDKFGNIGELKVDIERRHKSRRDVTRDGGTRIGFFVLVWLYCEIILAIFLFFIKR